MYEKIKSSLQFSYNSKVEEREASETPSWKVELRQRFLDLLRSESKLKILEVGAGTGLHGEFFQGAGLDVFSTDLSEAVVEACRAKGLDSAQMDFHNLKLENQTFDAVFSLNCFLHVPQSALPDVLREMHRVLRPNGLLYWGQYGGSNTEGTRENDNYEPKRFFSSLSNDRMKLFGKTLFSLESFKVLRFPGNGDLQFQSSIWRYA